MSSNINHIKLHELNSLLRICFHRCNSSLCRLPDSSQFCGGLLTGQRHVVLCIKKVVLEGLLCKFDLVLHLILRSRQTNLDIVNSTLRTLNSSRSLLSGLQQCKFGTFPGFPQFIKRLEDRSEQGLCSIAIKKQHKWCPYMPNDVHYQVQAPPSFCVECLRRQENGDGRD